VPRWADWLATHWVRGHRRHGIGTHTTTRQTIMRQTTTPLHSTNPTTIPRTAVHTDGTLGTATGKHSTNLSLMLDRNGAHDGSMALR
jgi:hypothetical protein